MFKKEQRDEILRIASRIEHASTEESEAYELANFHKYLDNITVPEGWQVVPVEPTREMLEAADEAYFRGYSGTATAHPASIYAKMIAAAPKPGGSNE